MYEVKIELANDRSWVLLVDGVPKCKTTDLRELQEIKRHLERQEASQ